MPKLWLIVTLTINIGLACYVEAAVASKVTHASSKGYTQILKRHKANKTFKRSKVRTKTAAIYRPKDVWERIRLGMQANTPIASLSLPTASTRIRADSDIDQLLQVSAVQFRLSKFHDFNQSALNMGLNPTRETLKKPVHTGLSVHYRTTIGQAMSIPSKNVTHDPLIIKTSSKCKSPLLFSGFKDKPIIEANINKSETNKPTFKIKQFNQQVQYPLQKVPYFPSQMRQSDQTVTCAANDLLEAKSESAAYNHQLALTNEPDAANDAVVRIEQQVAFFTKRASYLRDVSERARPYLYHIVDTLSNRKLPLELALLPIVESAFKATAQSPKSAAGLWQFIPSTGKAFALKQDDDYDERLDISASTDAALRFLSQLNKHYRGDWLLALAAYNSGQGRVDAAIKRNLAEGLPTDYWSLPLPAETKVYVPRLLALATIFENPAQYHVHIKPISNSPYFVRVNIDQSAEIQQLASKDLREVAELADFSYEQFMQLNPGYLKSTLSETGPYRFLMPAINANRLQQQLTYLAHAEIEERNQSPFLQTKFSVVENGMNTAKSGTNPTPALNPI